MKSRTVASVLLLAAGGLVGWWVGGRGDTAAVAQQPPPPPPSKSCLWRVQKGGKDGNLKLTLGAPRKCELDNKTYFTAEGTGDLRLTFDGGTTACDELAKKYPKAFPPKSYLIVDDGRVVRREHGKLEPRVAVYSGKFIIKEPGGKQLFVGDLEAVLGVGPNHDPLPPSFGNEVCNRQDRLEGWVRGRGEGEAKDLELHANLVAEIDFGEPLCRSRAFTLDGVVIDRH